MEEVSEASITTSAKTLEGNKNLRRACEYVSNTWFPIQASALETVQKRLRNGDYRENRDRLFTDLSADCGLFMLCVKRLSDLVTNRPDPLVEWVNPTELFDSCSLEDFITVLDTPRDLISQHRIEDCSEVQSERITEAAVSSQTALHLAQPLGISPQLSYTTALFRQLGLTLIAWNYPHVYARAVAGLSSERSPYQELDKILSRKLGFSPTMLGISLARSWSIDPQVRLAMGDNTAAEFCSEKQKATVETLMKVCEIGEALARASHPERYPSATADWEKAAEELKNALGKSGHEKLLASIRDGLQPYLKAAPQLFQLPAWSTKETPSTVREIVVRPTTRGNKYARHCPPEVQGKLLEIAELSEGATISKELIDTVIEKVILPLGFVSGCIYLIEPDQLVLMPRLAIGSKTLKAFKPLSYTSFQERNSPVVAAFRSNVPLLEEASDKAPASISAALGNTQRAGVLYLELSPQLSDDPLANPMVYFKAIREALNQCLQLQ